MKQKIIETQKGKFLIVDLPVTKEYREQDKNWQPIGFIKDLTEEEFEDFIDYIEDDMTYGSGEGYYWMYPYDEDNELVTESARESFMSLLQANDVLLENPIPEPSFMDAGPDGGGYDSNWIRDWHEAEDKVFINAYLFRLIE